MSGLRAGSLALLVVLLCACTSLLAADKGRGASGATAGGQRVALVIGNAAYPGLAALKNPVNDATDIAAKLTSLGFKVTLKTNAGLKEMLRTLTNFGDGIQPGAEVVFFYAGHGMQVRGRNFLIPVDAEIRSENAVSSEAVDVEQLLDKLSPARLSLVVLDACRNNPFERRFRGNGQGLASINAPTGTLIAYATAPGKVASDGDGRNGLYTQELLAAMSLPGIKVEDVFKRVRTGVVRKSGEAQVPWESSSLTGDFYFRPDGPAAVPPGAPAENASAEVVFWRSAERSDAAGDYEAYLKQFPAGVFSDLAKSRLALLKQPDRTTVLAGDRVLEAPPRLHVGDSWRYNDYSQVVEQAGDQGVSFRHTTPSHTSTLRTNREGNLLGSETALAAGGSVKVVYAPYLPALKYPLKPGVAWRETYQSSTATFLFKDDRAWEYEAKVVGWETVKVPAGSFEALRIDWWMRTSGEAGNQNGSSWYVPELKGMAKTLRYSMGKAIVSELESFTVQAD